MMILVMIMIIIIIRVIISTSRSCSCLINPDVVYDQKQRAFWMCLGLDSNLEIALSPLVHRDYGMHYT